MPHRGPDTIAANTIVKYGDFAFHEHGMPVPFVTMEQQMLNEHNGRWGRIDNITINGVISGQNFQGESNYGSGLIGMQSGLINGFSSDFKSFVIQDSGSTMDDVYIGNDCIVRGITFEESRYNMLVGYSINLQAHQAGYFESYGVLDPVDEFSYDEQQEDETITLTHNVSARGFKTSNTEAFDNAKTFVIGRTGLANSSSVAPKFISTGTCDEWVLKNQSETIDRINATYSVSEVYEMDTGNCDGTILRYACNIESGIQDDFVRGSIQGEVNGGKTGDLGDVRTSFENLDINNLFITATSDSHIDFFKIPITFNSEEVSANTKGDKKITFSAAYDNNNLPTGDASFQYGSGPCYFDYNVGVSMDEVTEIATVNLNGTIRSKGNLQERIANIIDFLNNSTDGLSTGDNGTGKIRTLARDIFAGVSGDFDIDHDLNIFPNSLSIVTGNKGAVNISATYDNSDRIYDAKIRGSSYNIDVKTALPIYKPRPSINENGVFAIYDTNVYGREVVNINGQIIPDHRVASLDNDDTVEASGSGVLNLLRTALVSGEVKRMESDASNRAETDGALSFGNTFSSNTKGIYEKANTQVVSD